MDVSVSSSSATTFTVVLVLALMNLPTSLGRVSKKFEICSRSFSCGNLTDISYPFYGDGRPKYCGHPGFELQGCNQVSDFPNIMILSQGFNVLGINSTSSTINIGRTDYIKRNGCPLSLANITIDLSLFQYAPSTENITLLYNDCSSLCSSKQLRPIMFPCPMNSTGNLNVCYLTKKMMVQSNISEIKCSNHILLPVQRSENEVLDQSGSIIDVSRAAWNGFQLKWRANNVLCEECLKSGGQCGHDWLSSKFFCFCPEESRCPFPGSITEKRTLTKPKIVMLASFSTMGVGLTIILASYFKRKCSSNNQGLEGSHTEVKQDIEAFLKNYGSPGLKRYTYRDLKRITNSFKDKLGEGGYGDVYRGKFQNEQVVAVKIIKKSEGDAEEFINEVASIGKTNHINVVTLLGFCYEGQRRALVYDFMSNGSLEKYIDGANKPPTLAWETLFKIVVGIARGLEYLHRGCNTRILHFDIKPHNILLDDNFCPKISDFGLAKSCPQKDSIVSMSTARGTVGYIAPEVFLRSFGGVSYKSDVYSYGMLVLEMVGCRRKVDAQVEESSEQYFPQWIYKQLEREDGPDDLQILSSEERELQRKMILVSLWCVQTNPSNRPDMSKVVEMLEGTFESLQIPPTTSLSSSLREELSSNTSTISI